MLKYRYRQDIVLPVPISDDVVPVPISDDVVTVQLGIYDTAVQCPEGEMSGVWQHHSFIYTEIPVSSQ
jgi:hypothetical protein